MYPVKYISCLICGRDAPKWLGVRGNREYAGAIVSPNHSEEHKVTNVVRCRHCSFVYTNPMMIGVGATADEGGYHRAEAYEATTSVEPAVLFHATLEKIEKERKPPGRLLDIGCGKGEFLNVARERGWSVAGIEQSRGMAAYAAQSSGLEVFCGEMKVAPWSENFFDVITMNMVLEHVHDPHSLFANVVRLLKKDGLLFIEVPNMDSWMLACARLYFRVRGLDWSPLLSPLHYPFHCYGYNKRSLQRLGSEHGLKTRRAIVTDTRWRGFRPEGRHRVAEKWAREAANRLSSWMGGGDVLMMIFQKNES